MPKILSIESSCDETSAAVLNISSSGTRKGLSNVVSSQMDIHRATQGVVPEVAARAHIKRISPVVQSALKIAKIKGFEQIDYIAVTAGPGLVSSLLVGTEYAKSLAFALDKKIIPVNHMKGHLYSALLENPKMTFPNISLIVSGGHTYLVLMKKLGNYKVLGQTVDDAVGEAFDKVARMLGLKYPGGPEISKAAQKGKKDYNFPRPMLASGNFDFSFAGLKTAVLYKIRDEKLNVKNNQTRADLAMSFENAAIDILIKKTIRAALKYGAKTISISGGVAANKKLREDLNNATRKEKLKFYVPAFSLCTDNALMIANAAAIELRTKKSPFLSYTKIAVDPTLDL
jgi:N6-L-threonylcarbamoyladenine synthase